MSQSNKKISNGKKKRGFHLNIHVILLSLIVIIFSISAVKLAVWNKGERIEIDPNADTSEFDVEALDSIMPLPESMKGDHVYDDETTILLLGNRPFFSKRDETEGLASQIAALTGATVYNGALPNTTLAAKNLNFSEADYPSDAFSLPYIADCICDGDLSLQEYIRETYRSDGNGSRDALQTIKTVDYNNLDIICIFYDYTDYTSLRAIEDPMNEESIVTWNGALRYAVRKIQQTYPYIRIIVMSPYYNTAVFEEGTEYDPSIMNLGSGPLPNYIQHQVNTCADLSISFIDNYYGSIHVDNYQDYLEDGSLTPAGSRLLAERFAEALNKYK